MDSSKSHFRFRSYLRPKKAKGSQQLVLSDRVTKTVQPTSQPAASRLTATTAGKATELTGEDIKRAVHIALLRNFIQIFELVHASLFFLNQVHDCFKLLALT